MATARPSPTPTSSNGASASWTPNPVPAPAPTVAWNATEWNNFWNSAYQSGFNSASRPTNSMYQDAIDQGYNRGLSDAQQRRTTTQSTPTSAAPVPTQSTPNSSVPNIDSQQNDLMNEINNLYGQSNDLFNQQESNLGSQRDTAISSVNAQGELGKKEYQSAYEQAMNSAKSQLNLLAQSKQSAQNEAIRNFNALSQNNQSRFGNSSSVGGAISEIVSQEFLRNQGQTRQAFQNSIDKVYSYEAQANQTYQLALEKLKDIADKIAAVHQGFQDGMLQVAMQRTTNEQARSAARIDLMRSALDNARAIQNYRIENQIKLDTWLQQQKQSSADALAYARQLATQAETNSFSNASGIQNINSSSFLNNGSSGNAIANVYRPQQRSYENEDYLNPWLS